MYMNELKEILQLAKELTQSNDIDIILQAAHKITEYNENKKSKYKFDNILPDLYIRDYSSNMMIKQNLSNEQKLSLHSILLSSISNLVIAPRQSGKSTLLQYLSLLICYTKPNNKILLISNKKQSSLELINNIKILHEMNINHDISIPIISHSNDKIVFANGSMILSRICNDKCTRGLSINYIFVDEACFISYSVMDSFLKSAYPSMATTNGKFVIISSPNEPDGPIYEIYKNPEKYNFSVDKWKPNTNIEYHGNNYNSEILGEFNTPKN